MTGGQGLAAPIRTRGLRRRARDRARPRAVGLRYRRAARPTRWRSFAGFSYVAVVEAAIGGLTAAPVFVGRGDPLPRRPVADVRFALLGGAPSLPLGALMFALDGRFIGLVTDAPAGGRLLVPAAAIEAAALDADGWRQERLVHESLAARHPPTRAGRAGSARSQRLGVPPAPALPSPLVWLLSLLRTRSALGLAPSLTPAAIFLPLGALLGPRGLGLLSPNVLERLDVAVTIALAVLGVLVGVALGREIRTALRLFVAASLESAVTIAAVTGATIYFVHARPACRSTRRWPRSRSPSASAPRPRRPRRRIPTRSPSPASPRASPIWMTCCRS